MNAEITARTPLRAGLAFQAVVALGWPSIRPCAGFPRIGLTVMPRSWYVGTGRAGDENRVDHIGEHGARSPEQ